MPQDDDGRPSFAEVVKAISPPGLNWDDWKAAMRQAHQDGGYRPGQVAPDISLTPQEAGKMLWACRPRNAERCCVCGSPQIVYRNYQDKAFCGPCANGEHPSQQPADPFTEADPASIALAEMYHGMVRAGIPVASVEGILGRMMAEHGRDDPEPPHD